MVSNEEEKQLRLEPCRCKCSHTPYQVNSGGAERETPVNQHISEYTTSRRLVL